MILFFVIKKDSYMENSLIIDNNNFDNFKSFVLTGDFWEISNRDEYYYLVYGNLRSCIDSESNFGENLRSILLADYLLDTIDAADIWEWFCNEFEENFYLFELGFVLEHFGFEYNFKDGKYIIKNEKLLNSFNQFLKDQE